MPGAAMRCWTRQAVGRCVACLPRLRNRDRVRREIRPIHQGERCPHLLGGCHLEKTGPPIGWFVTVIAAARFRVGGVTYASSWLSLPAKPSTKPIRHPLTSAANAFVTSAPFSATRTSAIAMSGDLRRRRPRRGGGAQSEAERGSRFTTPGRRSRRPPGARAALCLRVEIAGPPSPGRHTGRVIARAMIFYAYSAARSCARHQRGHLASIEDADPSMYRDHSGLASEFVRGRSDSVARLSRLRSARAARRASSRLASMKARSGRTR